MSEEEKINPGHSGIRGTFRAVGPAVAVIGLLLVIVGLASFFSAFGGGGPPKNFWCAFVGIPLLVLGIAICKFGYMGKIGRYVAGEVAPVLKDTVNYMADGTKDSVKTFAGAIGEGLRGGAAAEAEVKVKCHKCNALLDGESKFCNSCGAAIEKTKVCPQCQELNDPDAKFCDTCGYKFE